MGQYRGWWGAGTREVGEAGMRGGLSLKALMSNWRSKLQDSRMSICRAYRRPLCMAQLPYSNGGPRGAPSMGAITHSGIVLVPPYPPGVSFSVNGD